MTSLRRATLALLSLTPAFAGLACGSDAGNPVDSGTPDSGAPDGGAPDGGGMPDAGGVVAPAGVWTWVDVPGTACDDGSMTGIAVNPSPDPTSRQLFIYFMGGGACWDASTCFVLNTAVHGPFTQTQWAATGEPGLEHPLDRTRTTNPFRNASYVFVPYCTGDLHAGNNVASYDLLGPHPYHHVGRVNVEADLTLIHATWPGATSVVISGSSAGGYGATFNYDLIRQAYPSAKAVLVDDAGPLLEGTAIPPDERAAWIASWHIGDVITPICSTCINDDISQFYPALAALYPQDRMALMSSLQDQVIRTYFMASSPADYQAKLQMMIADRIVPIPAFHTFLIPGEMHTVFGMMDTIMAGGLTVEAWLGQMIGGDAGWTSVGP